MEPQARRGHREVRRAIRVRRFTSEPLALRGPQGPPGPSAVSTDVGNAARLGTDSLIYVPTVVPMGDNRIINGNFAINQRGQVSGTALAAAAYGHDRWKAGASGCTYTFTAALPDTTITITTGSLTQIIEGGNIEPERGSTSWQCRQDDCRL